MSENKTEVNMSNDEVVDFMKKAISKTQEDIETGNFDIVEFSRGLQSGMGSYLTPQMVNSNLKNINLNSQVGTYDDILKALQNPKTNEDTIISYSQNQYLTSYLYKRNFDYYANLLAFNLSINGVGIEPEDYKTTAYKKDWKIVQNFLDKFDYRSEFKKAVFNMLNSDLYPCMLRTDMSDDKYIFQDFPYKYAQIRGRSAVGLVCDYNLTFLMNGTQDIMMYSPPLRKKYKDLLSAKNRGYIPSADIGDAYNRSFSLWVMGDQSENFFAFKLTHDFMTEIPYFSPMLLDTSMGDVYRSLQLNQSIASARKIITSQWPMLKDTASGKQANSLAVTSGLMGSLVGACMAGLNANEKMFDLIALPSDKIEVYQMENKNSGMYQEYLKTISGLLGGANTLFSVQKQTSTESLISADIDKMFMEGIYFQFNEFLDYVINRLTKKYKFKFTLSGTNSYIDKEARIKKALDFAKVGIVSINKIATALDMNQIELIRELEQTKSSKLGELFMPMLNLYTDSGKDSSDSGRPQSSTTEISDSGQASRDSGSNVDRGGKI